MYFNRNSVDIVEDYNLSLFQELKTKTTFLPATKIWLARARVARSVKLKISAFDCHFNKNIVFCGVEAPIVTQDPQDTNLGLI